MRYILTFILSLFLNTQLFAADFDIYQSDYRPLQLALVINTASDPGVATDSGLATKQRLLLYQIAKNDLTSSQSFNIIDPMAFIASPAEAIQQIDYSDWTLIGTEILALCSIHQSGTDRVTVNIQVHDPFRNKKLIALSVEGTNANMRLLAHRVADQIYKAALGIPGYFTSHLLYVSKHGEYSDLVYMDQDGANKQAVGQNFTLLLSPDWSPNGHQVALNTYVGNHPRLEFFNLRSGKRTAFGNFKGLNSTPEFSPDGRFVAATLSYTGNTDIHIYDIKKGTWRQFTHNKGIDTTPTWSPDGKSIAFVSNRTGGPQVYRKAVSGGKTILVSTKGSYNTSPSWSPLGDRIAMISKKGWTFAVATVRIDGSDIRYLAEEKRIESPTWSPNGQMLLYSVEKYNIRRIYRVPSWGGKAEAITSSNIDASDPAWSRH
ncbi:Tol-Pal system beta propeller repeat protein TolB [Mariprofundus sp. EBB-1]|uniref:Tol-Pal system beta propeller repeat protein TolB n=1 Tax=Mariprofundus sp. EBB-1 TaxID=2650971 RepID=UPI000EF194FA|nr:Tol-Pal system beta propeller repeat protein TolB [Mariprofundus sp. EBB-1]RLL55576.1 Tol-Pal system beta propeller repeat protein TolB [Mariprofundus sp. EBB-1]